MNTLKQHRLKSIDELYIFSRTGVVQGSKNWSDTRVTGGGGGSQGNGIIAPVSISSTVTQRQRFFIVEASGRETEISDVGLSVRDGQAVTAVFCGKKNPVNDTGWVMGLFNHNTDNTRFLDGFINTITGAPKSSQRGWAAFLAVAAVIGAFTVGGWFWLLVPVAGVAVYLWWTAHARSKMLTAQLKERMSREMASRESDARALRQGGQAPAMEAVAAEA